jgi:iron complex transport system ATP-binding protein
VKAAALSARGLHLRHPGGNREVVRDLHLELHPGELLAIVGPNGSGKSTLLAALARDLVPQAGVVAGADGRAVTSSSRRAFARRVARLPQEPSCPPTLTVAELVAGGRHPHRRTFAGLGAADQAAIHRALVATDLEALLRRPVGCLSGGERRRAWLAMVLAQEADVLLLDEPLSGLDLGHRFEILEVLADLRDRLGRTLAVVLHDLAEAVRVCDRLAILHGGRLYACGPARAVLDTETLRDVFGLEARLEDTAEGLRLAVLGAARHRRFF